MCFTTVTEEKKYVLMEDGFIFGVINETQLESLKEIDTKGIEIYAVTNNYANYIDCIQDDVYRFTYNFKTDEITTSPVQHKDKRLSLINQFRESEDYNEIYFDSFDMDIELFTNVINVIIEADMDKITTIDEIHELVYKPAFDGKIYYKYDGDFVIEIDKLLDNHSVDNFPIEIKLPDNHPERSKKDKEKSDAMFESLKTMMTKGR